MLSEEPINDGGAKVFSEAFGLERPDVEGVGHRLVLLCLHVPGDFCGVFGDVLDILERGFVDVRNSRENHLINALFVHSNFGEGINLRQLATHLPRNLVPRTQILSRIEQRPMTFLYYAVSGGLLGGAIRLHG